MLYIYGWMLLGNSAEQHSQVIKINAVTDTQAHNTNFQQYTIKNHVLFPVRRYNHFSGSFFNNITILLGSLWYESSLLPWCSSCIWHMGWRIQSSVYNWNYDHIVTGVLITGYIQDNLVVRGSCKSFTIPSSSTPQTTTQLETKHNLILRIFSTIWSAACHYTPIYRLQCTPLLWATGIAQTQTVTGTSPA